MGSNSQPLCSFGDVAVTYRVYILDDLLAEPQEVCHGWGRNLLYVAQRYRQGHAYAPIEASDEISVVDLATAETVGVVDLCAHGYSAPHALELDHDAVYLLARVAEGMVWVDAESRCVTNFADRSQISASFNPSQHVMVPDSEQQDAESGLVTFSSPAIRFASRQSSDEMPVVAVEGDPIVAAIRHKFGVKTIYFTSRNVMLI
ncbi:YncE family protein [Apiospora arundinis]|uniref:YncE family protein n=1 Tax=Apiospora arundinis TaxID=335852 RepID=A0ABR2J3N1_9PEZI